MVLDPVGIRERDLGAGLDHAHERDELQAALGNLAIFGSRGHAGAGGVIDVDHGIGEWLARAVAHLDGNAAGMGGVCAKRQAEQYK